MMRDILLETLQSKDHLVFDLSFRRIEKVTPNCYSINYLGHRLIVYHYEKKVIKVIKYDIKGIHYHLTKLSEIL